MKITSQNTPICFISYSWDSDDHKIWVLRLAEKMRENGVDARLDQWDLSLGYDLYQYLESSISKSDYVVIICTQNYATRANLKVGGVGFEKTIITGELYDNAIDQKKFVPILRSGNLESSLPSYLKTRIFVDFRRDDLFAESFEELLRHIYQVKKYPPPPIGSPPDFILTKNSNTENATASQAETTKLFHENLKGPKESAIQEINSFHRKTKDTKHVQADNKNNIIKKYKEIKGVKLRIFNQAQLAELNNAAHVSEQFVAEYYKLTASGWLKGKYDIRTLIDLTNDEYAQGPFGQIIRYVAKRKDEESFGSLGYNFYKICIYDDAIISLIERNDSIALLPFLIYTLCQLLVHVVRFSKFIANFNAGTNEIMNETHKAHSITREILSSQEISGIKAVLDYYGGWKRV